MSDKPDNRPQMASPSYRLAARDSDFILGDTTRGVRFLLEYEKADQILRRYGIRSTLVVFGSARIAEDGPGEHARWYRTARDFARIASERGGALAPRDGLHDNVIATGGGPGIMAAANRGAAEAGAPTIGFNITLPHEQEPNGYSTPELTFRFHYFAMRKMHLAMRANALVVFPGGFGTFDELFEVLTLIQTRKATAIPVVLIDEAYWRSILNLEQLVHHGMVREADLELFRYAETAESIWSTLTEMHIGTHRRF